MCLIFHFAAMYSEMDFACAAGKANEIHFLTHSLVRLLQQVRFRTRATGLPTLQLENLFTSIRFERKWKCTLCSGFSYMRAELLLSISGLISRLPEAGLNFITAAKEGSRMLPKSLFGNYFGTGS